MGCAERVEHVGVAVVHLRVEVPLLAIVVQERPDVVDGHVVLAIEERRGGQPVAELVAAAIDGAPVGQHEGLDDLTQRDPEVDEHQVGVEILPVG